jgi:type IV pilus assembly protein PilB
MDNIIGGDFEFDEMSTETVVDTNDKASEVDDAPVVKFLHKMLMDAFNMRASDLHFEPYEHNYRVRFGSTASCVRSPHRRLPSRTSWPRASR